MVPVELEGDLRDLDLFFGNSHTSMGGPRARDLTSYPRNHVPFMEYREPEFVVESRVINPDGSVRIEQPRERVTKRVNIDSGKRKVIEQHYCPEIPEEYIFYI